MPSDRRTHSKDDWSVASRDEWLGPKKWPQVCESRVNSPCGKCQKPVYLAEMASSMNQPYHIECLRCAMCDAKLSVGSHATFKGMPFCHHPCHALVSTSDVSGAGRWDFKPGRATMYGRGMRESRK